MPRRSCFCFTVVLSISHSKTAIPNHDISYIYKRNHTQERGWWKPIYSIKYIFQKLLWIVFHKSIFKFLSHGLHKIDFRDFVVRTVSLNHSSLEFFLSYELHHSSFKCIHQSSFNCTCLTNCIIQVSSFCLTNCIIRV